jgi:predicted Zn-dependent protease
MIDTIRAAVEADGRASDYRISQSIRHGVEWYLVKDRLDTARSLEIGSYTLTLYVDSGLGEGKTRGAYSLAVQPSADAAELRGAIERGIRAAGGMKNAWYPLPDADASRGAAPQPPSAFSSSSLESAMPILKEALYARDGEGGSRINSLELFLSRSDERIVNSRGVDLRYTLYKGYCEYIVNASAPGKDEIELYGELEFSEPDLERLSAALGDKLKQARDRLSALPTPDCAGLPVLFKAELAEKIYSYWFDACQNAAAYQKTAPFALGESVGAVGGGGDPISLKALPYLSGSPRSAPYDADGMALKPVECIVENRLERLIGPLKYAHYLKQSPAGALPVFALEGGARSGRELASVPHLEASSFSDFFVDPTTGDFGGELRLGYLYRDGKRSPVSGGSITGNLAENRGAILLSRELEARASCLAPAACLIPSARIASAG